jgi:imidazole glycerol phosphate synthase subunit HisF
MTDLLSKCIVCEQQVAIDALLVKQVSQTYGSDCLIIGFTAHKDLYSGRTEHFISMYGVAVQRRM